MLLRICVCAFLWHIHADAARKTGVTLDGIARSSQYRSHNHNEELNTLGERAEASLDGPRGTTRGTMLPGRRTKRTRSPGTRGFRGRSPRRADDESESQEQEPGETDDPFGLEEESRGRKHGRRRGQSADAADPESDLATVDMTEDEIAEESSEERKRRRRRGKSGDEEDGKTELENKIDEALNQIVEEEEPPEDTKTSKHRRWKKSSQSETPDAHFHDSAHDLLSKGKRKGHRRSDDEHEIEDEFGSVGEQEDSDGSKDTDETTTPLLIKGIIPRNPDGSERTDGEKGNKTEPLRVFSYNICWGCMEADELDGTGMKSDLKAECRKRTKDAGTLGDNGMGLNVTRCAENMGRSVAEYYADVGGYDLMAFQEASNFGDLYLQDRGIGLTRVEYGAPLEFDHWQGIHQGELKRTWIVTLYDKHRLGNHDKEVIGVLKSDEGRPFLILIFDSVGLIFINLHNAQPRGSKKASWDKFPAEMHETLKESFAEGDFRQDYRVIMAGDFNDLKAGLPGFKLPWNGKVMNIQEPRAVTCCSTDVGKGKLPRGVGDFIFDSADVIENRIPRLFNSKLPQSDHRPVEATLSAL